MDATRFYNEIRGGVNVTRYPETCFFFDAPINPQIALHTLRCDYDILHIHGVTPTISDLAIILGRLKRKPIIFTYHNSPVPDYGGRCSRFISTLYVKVIDRFIVKLVNKVVTDTTTFAIHNPTLKTLLNGTVAIPWGVHLPNPKPEISELNKNSIFKLLFVGQLKKYKGINYLLEAVKILEDKGIALNLVIVGDGPERKNIEAYSRSLNCKAKITGSISESSLNHYYSASDALVLPSISGREAFGLVLLEAMSYGKPVVVSNIAGPNEVVKDGYNGLLVKSRSPQAIANAIEKLVKNPVLYQKLSENAMRTAEQYSWEKVGDRYIEVYTQALQ